MNGYLLRPNLDKAFDNRLISFGDKSEIFLSSKLTEDLANTLGLHPDMSIKKTLSYHHPYLKFHREHVFQKKNYVPT